MTINFLTFKKHLTDNNILLFDSQYRIAHFRYNNLNKNDIITKLNNVTLHHFVNSLLNKNTERINWIINKFNNK
jgi:hypothetical protein